MKLFSLESFPLYGGEKLLRGICQRRQSRETPQYYRKQAVIVPVASITERFHYLYLLYAKPFLFCKSELVFSSCQLCSKFLILH